MTIAIAKAAVRRDAFARRKSAHTEGDHCGILKAHLAEIRGAAISAYMPIRTEIDPLPAMHDLARFNRICVPVIIGPNQPLLFHEWTPAGTMKDGPFGAKIPVDEVPLVPEIVIAPLLAFNDACYRLGYGGGFYDRTLEVLRALGSVTAYGFAYAAQHRSDLPLEPTDQPLDAVITERGIVYRE